jgi:heme/copper-type cytochrome/quinol oxidase subunit 2
MNQLRHKTTVLSACLAVVLLATPFVRSVSGRDQGTREFTISANHFAFSPARIEVQKDDLVKITLTAVDIAHSFTIDQYRIAKRAAAGHSVVFEFRADRVGTHRFYCNLTIDERCRKMEGELVVK